MNDYNPFTRVTIDYVTLHDPLMTVLQTNFCGVHSHVTNALPAACRARSNLIATHSLPAAL